MANIRYINATAPFWDFVANMESAAGEHPFFNAYNSQNGEARQEEPPRDGPPPPPPHDGPAPPTEPQNPDGPPPPGHHHPRGPHHRHGGPPGAGWGRHHGGRRGGCGGPGRGGFPFGGLPHRGFGGFGSREGPHGFDMNPIAQFFGQQFGLDTEGAAAGEKKDSNSNTKDFAPSCDVFDTEDAFVIHLSLPGAKKEDVGVNWDADKSELSVAGVIYRPGDEELLKTLAMDERQVGPFERKVRLGSRARPAQVEVDEISAKMEDGILIVRVPKLDGEYVDVKKVEIE